MNIDGKLFVVDLSQLDAYPTFHAYIRRMEECLRPPLDQRLLFSWWHGKPDRYMTVTMDVIREVSVDLSSKERGCSVREPFGRVWQVGTKLPNSPDLLVINV